MDNIEPFDKVKFIREEIRFQHNLINSRIASLLASESFMFTAFAISRGGGAMMQLVWFWKYLLPVGGLVLATLAFPSIWGAVEQIEDQRRLLKRYDLDAVLPIGDPHELRLHRFSLAFSIVMPVIFAGLWLVVFFLSYR